MLQLIPQRQDDELCLKVIWFEKNIAIMPFFEFYIGCLKHMSILYKEFLMEI